MTVAGISCRLVLSSTSSIESALRPVSPSAERRFAASMPAGVAALPSPRRFADRFMDIALHAASSVKPGNSGRSKRRNTFPSRFTSPVSRRISMIPLHIVIVASKVTISVTACVPLDKRAPAVSPALPVTNESSADNRIKTVHTFPIIFTHSSQTFPQSYILRYWLWFQSCFLYHFIIFCLTTYTKSGRIQPSAVCCRTADSTHVITFQEDISWL